MSKYENFEIQTISRRDIKKAKYNPRIMDTDNSKRLQSGIEDVGLVVPLVWNKRTGNLVGGHQRLTVLDKLEKSKDYELDVAVIDVDEKTEKKINVQLNNPSMQGDFDFDMLGELALEFDNGLFDLGFSDFDIEMMFGTNEKFQELLPDAPAVEAAKADLNEIKENRAAMNEKYKEEQNADYYFVVVCKDQKEKDELLGKMSVPNTERYVNSTQLKRIMKEDKKGDS